MKTGLVLEGGGVRGIYTAGILDVFMENNLVFDGIVGVSAGAVHAVSYLSGQKGRSIRYYSKYCNDERFMSFRSFIKTGNIVGVDFCYHELPEKLDVFDNHAFMKNPTPLYVTVTNVDTGKPEYIHVNDAVKQIDYIRASASLPFFSKIVEIDGKKYLDGGCSDSIPLSASKKLGFDKNVVILTRDINYRKKPTMKALAKFLYRKHPAFSKVLLDRYSMYNNQVEETIKAEQDGDVFVFRPSSPLEIGRMENDAEKIRLVYNRGRHDAIQNMEKLKDWLRK